MRSVLLALSIALPALCQAETCPWINAATVGGVLGGAVTSSVTPSTCFFARTTYRLQVTVETMATLKDFARYTGTCRSKPPTSLKALGNEAVACTTTAGEGERAEQIVGRVRDRAFVIRIVTKDRSQTEASLGEKVRAVAEQVAGNLF